MLFAVQDQPLVVELLRQPEATRDVSIDAVLAMFALAGVAILLAAIGGLLAGAILVVIRRLRDGSSPPSDTSHVRLRI